MTLTCISTYIDLIIIRGESQREMSGGGGKCPDTYRNNLSECIICIYIVSFSNLYDEKVFALKSEQKKSCQMPNKNNKEKYA